MYSMVTRKINKNVNKCAGDRLLEATSLQSA